MFDDYSFWITNEFDKLEAVGIRMPANNIYDPSSRNNDILEKQKAHYSWNKSNSYGVRKDIERLVMTLTKHNVEVIVLEGQVDYPAQHFPRDIGFVIGPKLFIGNLRSEVRRGEELALLQQFSNNPNIQVIDRGFIEGGDVVLSDRLAFVGLSEESDLEGCKSLQSALTKDNANVEVVPIEFAHDGILHLDTVFNIVAPSLALFRPGAFCSQVIRRFERDFELIPVSEAEALDSVVNTLSIDKKTVVMRSKQKRLISELEHRKLVVIPIEFSEVCKLPGSFRCCTIPLRRFHRN